MNTFLKILLIAAILVVAIKLSPILAFGAFVGLIVATVLGAIGISLLAAFLGVLIALAVALSPIWIPVLVIMGIVSLFRRNNSTPTPPSAPLPPAVAA